MRTRIQLPFSSIPITPASSRRPPLRTPSPKLIHTLSFINSTVLFFVPPRQIAAIRLARVHVHLQLFPPQRPLIPNPTLSPVVR